MYGKFQDFLKTELQSIKDAGLYKSERIIVTPQGAEIKLATGETVLNFCANILSVNRFALMAQKAI